MYFWKYPEDEGKVAPSEQISMHDCFTELPVSLAPREVCSRLNTFMLETQRRLQPGDKNALNMHLVCNKKVKISTLGKMVKFYLYMPTILSNSNVLL